MVNISGDDCIELLRVGERPLMKESFVARALASWYYQLKILFSYKMHLALEMMDIILSALIYYFVSFLVSPQDLVALGYSPDYVAFSISGIALSRYIWTSVSRLARKMHHEISAGTFESLVAVDTDNFHSWLIGQVLYGFTWSSMWFIGTLIIGFVLGAGFTSDPWIWIQAGIVVILVVIVHSAIGIMAAGMYIVHKQLETMLVLMSTVIEFFGGVIYPLSILLNYPILYYISLLMPFTHGLELFRRAIIDGTPIYSLGMLVHLSVLLLFLPLVYVGFKVFERYLNLAKKNALLSVY